MPWTELASAAVPGELVRLAVLVELHEAIDERLKAVNPAWEVDLAASATVADFRPFAVTYTGPDLSTGTTTVTQTANMFLLLRMLSRSYVPPRSVEDNNPFSGYDFTDTYAAEQIFTDAEAIVGSGLSAGFYTSANITIICAAHFNTLKACIQLLRWRVSDATSNEDFEAHVTTSSGLSFAAAKTEWAGSADTGPEVGGLHARFEERDGIGGSTAGFSLESYSPGSYTSDDAISTAQTAKQVAIYSVPGFGPGDYCPGSFTISAGGGTADLSSIAAGEQWILGPASLAVSGAVTVGLALAMDADADEWDAYDTAATTAYPDPDLDHAMRVSGFGLGVSSIAWAPDFEYT